MGPQIYNNILSEIRNDRDGKIIDRIALKHIVYMLEFLPVSKLDGDSIYFAEFEKMVCDDTREYFGSAADNLLNSSQDAAIYINQTSAWLKSEEERCNLYLSAQSLPILLATLKDVLIRKRFRTVMELPSTGFRSWIENDKYSELKLLHELTALVSDTFDDAKEMLNIIILEKGQEINQASIEAMAAARQNKGPGKRSDSANPTSIAIQWVEQVMSLKDKYDNILIKCYGNNTGLRASVESSFSKFVNQIPKVSEYLSLFIDDNLKKSLKGKSDMEVEEALDKSVVLFRFIAEKDVFETYYKAHFAKRLLNGRSLSDDIERSMIAKLKMEIGTSFTTKLEGMFRDMKTSKDMMAEYKTGIEKKKGDIDINVNVLTSTVWPVSVVSAQVKCIFPPEVEAVREKFEKFYLTRHNGRKLEWNSNMGTADVRARFNNKMHEINMPTFAMVILMQFNDLPDDQFLTFEQLKEATNIPDADLTRHLQSIAVAPRTRLLRKEPMSKDINPGDKFYFNAKFESPMTRIKVLAVTSSNRVENDSERKETTEKVDIARKHEADAAVVRIMKYVIPCVGCHSANNLGHAKCWITVISLLR